MAFQPDTFYTITNKHSDLQLAISRGSGKDGAQLIQWPADGTFAQIFLVVGSGPGLQFLTLTSLLTLGISRGSKEPGAEVVQWIPDSSFSQRFMFTPAEDGYLAIASALSGLVLGIADGSVQQGAAVVQWEPVGSADQQFTLEDAGAGYVSIRNRKSGLLLAVSGGSVKRGAELVQWPADGSEAQRFLVVGDRSTGCMILPKASVKVLGIANGSVEPGADVIQWHPDGAANQRFGLSDPDPGFTEITSPVSGLVLGIADSSSAPAARAVQWTSTGAADQQFQLKPVSLAHQQLTATDLAENPALFEAMRTYCPELRLHPMERYFPDDIGHFIAGSLVRDKDDIVVLAHPTAADLVQYGEWGTQPGHADKEAYYLSPPHDWSDPIITGVTPAGRVPIESGKYKGGFSGGTISVPIAVRGFSVNGTYWFDYVYFYPYNGEQVMHIEYYMPNLLHPIGTGHLVLSPMATHLGDWEHAQVQVSGDLKRIIAIRTFNHGDQDLIRNSPDDPAWRRLKFTDSSRSHVVLYSGLHSHATYASAEHHLQGLGSPYDELVEIFGVAIHSVHTDDWCSDGGAIWRGWENLVPFGVDASSQALPGFPDMQWPDFYPHRWGRSRTFTSSTDVVIRHVGPEIGWATGAVRGEFYDAVKAGIVVGIDQLTDGKGVSPPDWWRSGF